MNYVACSEDATRYRRPRHPLSYISPNVQVADTASTSTRGKAEATAVAHVHYERLRDVHEAEDALGCRSTPWTGGKPGMVDDGGLPEDGSLLYPRYGKFQVCACRFAAVTVSFTFAIHKDRRSCHCLCAGQWPRRVETWYCPESERHATPCSGEQ